MRIPLSAPDIGEDEIAAVVRVLRSSRLSLGPVLGEFENAFAEYVGSSHAVAVSSGTAGLHLALLALGIGVGDEVIVPSFTFIAAANAIRYVGAAPVFVEIDPGTLNLDPGCVERAITAKTRALMVVHTFGVPADLGALLAIAARHGLKVIEDACEAIGAEYRLGGDAGRRVGGFGDVGVFAFYPNKQITTGEGGMTVVRDPAVAATVRSLRNQGRRAWDDWLEHSEVGYNYRIAEINCALGLAQLRRVEEILARRRAVAEEYDRRLHGCSDLVLPPLAIPDGVVSWFVYVVRLGAQFSVADRDAIRACFQERGIGCGRYFAPIHRQPAYRPLGFQAGGGKREFRPECGCRLPRRLRSVRWRCRFSTGLPKGRSRRFARRCSIFWASVDRNTPRGSVVECGDADKSHMGLVVTLFALHLLEIFRRVGDGRLPLAVVWRSAGWVGGLVLPQGPMLLLSIAAFVFFLLWVVAWRGNHRILDQQQLLQFELLARDEELKAERSELANAREALRLHAIRDELTGLPNRASIVEVLEREIARSVRDKGTLSIVLADVDHLGKINEMHGQAAGDEVLKEVGRRLEHAIRSYDAAGRYRGGEFLLVLPSFEADTGVERLRKIHDSICGKAVSFNSISIPVTCSFGVSISLPNQFYSSDELLERASQAMSTAKQDGRNRIGFFARSEN